MCGKDPNRSGLYTLYRGIQSHRTHFPGVTFITERFPVVRDVSLRFEGANASMCMTVNFISRLTFFFLYYMLGFSTAAIVTFWMKP